MQWMLGREVPEDVMPVVLCCGKGHCATCHLNGVNQEEKLLLTSSCYLTWPAIAPWFWDHCLSPSPSSFPPCFLDLRFPSLCISRLPKN